jgi:hypothetical protein
MSVCFAAILCGPSLAMAQSLGAAEAFAVLGGSAVTNTGPSVIRGDLGLSPNNLSSITGFPPGLVYGTTHAADGVALAAQNSATTLYNTLAGQAVTVDLSGQVLGSGGSVPTLTPGVYFFSSSAQLTGALILNAGGNPNATWVFQIGSSLTTASGSSVVMSNGGSPCNVFWQVGSSATLGTTTSFLGNIVALTSITLNTGANVTGRTLARNGAVTLDTNNIDATVCGAPVTPPQPVPTLPGWALIALMALLALAGFEVMRRRAV